jgi:hypothetical protein
MGGYLTGISVYPVQNLLSEITPQVIGGGAAHLDIKTPPPGANVLTAIRQLLEWRGVKDAQIKQKSCNQPVVLRLPWLGNDVSPLRQRCLPAKPR